MKKILFAAFVAVLALAGCEKQEVINSNVATSEVVATWIDEQVTVNADENGTVMTYNSGVEVVGQTRTNFDSKFSVELTNSFKNEKKEQIVDNWGDFEPKIKTYRKAIGSKRDGYIKITDSVLVREIIVGDVKYVQEFYFQVAEYNDGHTKMTLPYYGVEVIDNDMTIKPINSVEKNGKAYARRIYAFSSIAMVNGKNHVKNDEIIAYHQIEKINGRYILNSNILEKNLQSLESQDGRAGFVAKAKVNSEYSDGKKGPETYTETVYAYGEPVNYHPSGGGAVKVKNRSDVQLKKATWKVDAKEAESLTSGSKYLLKTSHTDVVTLDLGVFTKEVTFKREDVVFDNGVLYESLTEKMRFDENSVRISKTTWTKVENGIYNVELAIEATMNGQPVVVPVTFLAKN